jgi:hypothetical protein
MLQIAGGWWIVDIADIAAAGHQGVGGLAEEERWLAPVGTHFGGVRGVILPDAVHPANREEGVATRDGNAHLGGGRKGVSHTCSL